jgi:hypothetical protein
VAGLAAGEARAAESLLIPPPDLSEVFRSPLALLALDGLAAPAATGVETYLAVLAGLVVVQLVLLLPALALLAFVVGLARRRICWPAA